MKIKIIIQENSLLARLASWKLRSRSVAIVFGRTIHLHNTTKETFLANEEWLKHELKHIEQYRQYGTIPFLWYYFIDWIKNGYHNNKFEIEAREAEKATSIDWEKYSFIFKKRNNKQ